jgi:hypoxanthine phosphoribosyltransferase
MIRVTESTITFQRSSKEKVTKEYLLELGKLPTGHVINERLANWIMSELRDSYFGFNECGQFIWRNNLDKYAEKAPAKIRMTWGTFDLLADQIVQEYKGSGIKKIVGLTRGGLPLAVKLSNELDIPMEALTWQTRDGELTQDLRKIQLLNRTHRRHEILFVDDICDTGVTIKQIDHFFPGAMFTTLIDKIPNQQLVDYTPSTKFECENKWVVFPWEKQ